MELLCTVEPRIKDGILGAQSNLSRHSGTCWLGFFLSFYSISIFYSYCLFHFLSLFCPSLSGHVGRHYSHRPCRLELGVFLSLELCGRTACSSCLARLSSGHIVNSTPEAPVYILFPSPLVDGAQFFIYKVSVAWSLDPSSLRPLLFSLEPV